MHRPAEFKIAAEADGQVVEPSLFTVYREQVGEGLGRVAVTAVARIDDGYRGVHCRHERRPLLRVAHGDDVGVAGYDLRGIRYALSFGSRGALSLGKAEHAAAQLKHRRLKAETGPCGRLKKQGRELLALALLAVFCGGGYNIVGSCDKLLYLGRGKLRNINKASHFIIPLRRKF